MPGVLTLPQAPRQLGMELQHTGMGWIQPKAQGAGSCVPMTSLAAIHPRDKTNITFITQENLSWVPQKTPLLHGHQAGPWSREKAGKGTARDQKVPVLNTSNNFIGKT